MQCILIKRKDRLAIKQMKLPACWALSNLHIGKDANFWQRSDAGLPYSNKCWLFYLMVLRMYITNVLPSSRTGFEINLIRWFVVYATFCGPCNLYRTFCGITFAKYFYCHRIKRVKYLSIWIHSRIVLLLDASTHPILLLLE